MKKPKTLAVNTRRATSAELQDRIDKLTATITAQQDAHAETMHQRDVFARELKAKCDDFEMVARQVAQLTIDRDNLLGTIRVMSDPNREIRIRMSTVKPADYATALPSHNVG
jgi:septal ring factor EnvC (AmiA/AmiB activator)